MTKIKLNDIVKKHEKWLNNEEGGVKANLRYADLSYANLSSANLRYANLRYAKGIYLYNPLKMLKEIDKQGYIYAWKYEINGMSPYQNAKYEIGKKYYEKDYDIDEFTECGRGLNIAHIKWCYYDNLGKDNLKFIKVRFKANDIVAIPHFTDGKFRVKRFEVIKKYTLKQIMKMYDIKEG